MFVGLIQAIAPVSYLVYLNTIATNHRRYHPHTGNATINDWQFQSMSLSTFALFAGFSLRTWLLLTQIPALLFFYHGVFLAQRQYQHLTSHHQHPPLGILRNLSGANNPKHQATLYRARQASWVFNVLGLFGLPSALLTPTIVLIYRLIFPFHSFSLQSAFDEEYAYSPARDSTENSATFFFKWVGLGIFLFGFSRTLRDLLSLTVLPVLLSHNFLLVYFVSCSTLWLVQVIIYNSYNKRKTLFINLLYHGKTTLIPEKVVSFILQIHKLPITLCTRTYLALFTVTCRILHAIQFYRISGWLSRHSTDFIAIGLYSKILTQAIISPANIVWSASLILATLFLAKRISTLSPALTQKINTLETINACLLSWTHAHIRTRLLSFYQYFVCAPLLASQYHDEIGHTPVKGYQTKTALMNPIFVIEEDKNTQDKNYCPSIEQWYFIGILFLQYFFSVIKHHTEQSLALLSRTKSIFLGKIYNMAQPIISLFYHTALLISCNVQACTQITLILLSPITRTGTWLLSTCNIIPYQPSQSVSAMQDFTDTLHKISHHAINIPLAIIAFTRNIAANLIATYLILYKLTTIIASEVTNSASAILTTPWHITKLTYQSMASLKSRFLTSPSKKAWSVEHKKPTKKRPFEQEETLHSPKKR